MDKLHEGLVEKANKFLELVIEAREIWGELIEEGRSSNRIMAEQCPQEFQTLYAMFGQSEFNTAMPRMVNYTRGYGGFEIFLSKPEEEVEEEKPKVKKTINYRGRK